MMPVTISQGNYSTQYIYAADNQLLYRKDTQGTQTEKESWYFSDMQYTRDAGATSGEKTFYVAEGVEVTIKDNSTDQHLQFSVSNQIGSAVLITNGDGSLKQRLRYDPFGKVAIVQAGNFEAGRVSWKGDEQGEVFAAMQGFTGHEHLYQMNLIHMKGRVYDPTIGRFLQADVVVQSPNQILSYNRYAYVWNNPLANTDPSGYVIRGESGEVLESQASATTNPAKEKNDNNVSAPNSNLGNQSNGSNSGGNANNGSTPPDNSQNPTPEKEHWWEKLAHFGGKVIHAGADLAGKVWSAPTTAFGIVFGLTGHIISEGLQMVGLWNREPEIYWFGNGHNAIEFTGNIFMFSGAVAFGNTITIGSKAGQYNYEDLMKHEPVHTVQGQYLGPLYIPVNAVAMTISTVTYPFPSTHRSDGHASFAHGKLNFMEGPIFGDSLYGF